MLLRLLATFILAVGVAGAVIFANRYIFRKRLPKWVMPVAIAVTIVSFQIFDEYSWYQRIKTQIADKDYVVMQEQAPKQPWRPWSFVAPSVTGVTVVNRANLQVLKDHPEYNIGMMTSLSYLGLNSDFPFVFDCNDYRFGPYTQNFDQIEWAPLPPELAVELCIYYE